MENLDLGELLTAIGGLGAAIVTLGAIISRFTKTPKDDVFFDKMKAALFLKKLPPSE